MPAQVNDEPAASKQKTGQAQGKTGLMSDDGYLTKPLDQLESVWCTFLDKPHIPISKHECYLLLSSCPNLQGKGPSDFAWFAAAAIIGPTNALRPGRQTSDGLSVHSILYIAGAPSKHLWLLLSMLQVLYLLGDWPQHQKLPK